MESTPTLEFGLQPRGPFTVAWGARAIFTPQPPREPKKIKGRAPKAYPIPNEIDILWDRQSCIFDGSENERKAFTDLLNDKILPALREKVHKSRFDRETDEDAIVEVNGYKAIANPRRSYGYIYLVVYK
jgi:hypothetical protein